MTLDKHIKVDLGTEFILSYLKRDIPCFQFTGFQVEDRAGAVQMRQLLAAIIQVGDWAQLQCSKLSDKYPALHNLRAQGTIILPNFTKIALDRRDPSVYLTVVDGICVVPPVWYSSGSTQMMLGRLEAAVRESLVYLK